MCPICPSVTRRLRSRRRHGAHSSRTTPNTELTAATGHGHLPISSMLLCGIGASNITATPGTPLGGYWGRDPVHGTTGTADPLFCKVLTLNKLNENGMKNWFCIVSLDLIGLHASTCQTIKKDIIASVQGGLTLDSNSIMICCTHTHTGPQTHTSFIGMGHVSEVYQQLLRKRVVNAFQESLGNISPACLYHGKTKPLRQVGINRRQRVAAKESTPPTPPRPIFTVKGDCSAYITFYASA